jgi:hypothetical protein
MAGIVLVAGGIWLLAASQHHQYSTAGDLSS